MPIMAAHNESSNYSPPNNVFYNTNYSPESPTHHNRKRKQQEFQTYGNQQRNGLENLYQSYNQSWNHHANQQEFIVPISSSSSSTTTNYQQQHEESNLTWQRTTNNQDAFIVSNNYQHTDPFMDSTLQKSNNGGVGENSEIHHLLNLDQPSSAFQFIDTQKDNNNSTRTLHLHDLGNSRLIQHQPWSASPQPQQQYNGANSPGFFTPGFLESLQEDENESPQSFPFHVLPSTRHWNTTEDTKSNIEPDSILVKIHINL